MSWGGAHGRDGVLRADAGARRRSDPAVFAPVLEIDGFMVVVDEHLGEEPLVVLECFRAFGGRFVPDLSRLLAHDYASPWPLPSSDCSASTPSSGSGASEAVSSPALFRRSQTESAITTRTAKVPAPSPTALLEDTPSLLSLVPLPNRDFAFSRTLVACSTAPRDFFL